MKEAYTKFHILIAICPSFLLISNYEEEIWIHPKCMQWKFKNAISLQIHFSSYYERADDRQIIQYVSTEQNSAYNINRILIAKAAVFNFSRKVWLEDWFT